MKKLSLLLLMFMLLVVVSACQSPRLTKSTEADETVTVTKLYDEHGSHFTITLTPGRHHNHPTFAIWIEDIYGSLVQTVFVTQSIATGYYRYGDAGDGTWLKTPGEAIRPAALPYWMHKREGFNPAEPKLPSPDMPFPDAMTAATPPARLLLESKINLPDVFRIVLEVNQPWDWNNHWTNSKFPGNVNYMTSAQPSVIYAVTVNLNDGFDVYHLNPIGHGSYDGSDGMLYTDLSTLTTALQIFTNLTVKLK
jgi:hypothetical protein